MEAIKGEIGRARRATQLIFLVCGLGISSWVPMVPYAKDRLGLHEGHLGVLLLFLGFGALVMMPLSGVLINRYGSRIVIAVSALMMAFFLPLLLIVKSSVLMACVLFMFGAGVGSIDVAMNSHGIQVQNVYGRQIMSSLHGLFSVGGLLGALGLGFLVKLGLQPEYAAIGIALLLVVLAVSQFRFLLDHSTEKRVIDHFTQSGMHQTGNAKFKWLRGSVVFLGALCFSVFLAEGAVLDWSAVFLRDVKGVEAEFTGLGYASFSVAMAVMRLTGDGLAERMGNKTMVVGGSLLATAGLLITLVSPSIPVVIIGYILLGMGAANIVPILFSDGGKLPGISPSISIPAITTMGYAGQLAGPAALGFIAHHFSLSAAFGLTAILMLLVGGSYLLKNQARADG